MPKKILIVEDDQQVARVYGIKFSGAGYEVVSAFDGEEGIGKINAERPDIVLLDLMLPRKDGFAVLEEMKKNGNLSKIPVIVLSNLGQDEDRERALKLGAVDYIVKADSTIQEIVEKVGQYLK